MTAILRGRDIPDPLPWPALEYQVEGQPAHRFRYAIPMMPGDVMYIDQDGRLRIGRRN